MIVTAWTPEFATPDKVALPPCHFEYQFQVEGNRLNCGVTMRSVDVFLGLPFNIASYATLTHMIAQVTDKIPGRLTFTLRDTHIYLNHLGQVQLQISREPRPLPTLVVNPSVRDINNVTPEDISITGYNPHPSITGEISL